MKAMNCYEIPIYDHGMKGSPSVGTFTGTLLANQDMGKIEVIRGVLSGVMIDKDDLHVDLTAKGAIHCLFQG